MARKYTIEDIKDYLFKYYKLDWKDEIVKYIRAEKKINERKFYLLSKDNGKTAYFKAVVYKNNEKHVVFVSVSEKFLKIEGYEEPEVSWEDFYTKRHNSELTK